MSISRILFPENNRDGSHLSRHSITAAIKRSTRRRSGRTTLSEGEPCRNLLLDLAPSGVCPVPTKPAKGRLVGISFETSGITSGAVGFYPAFSPLPAEGGLSPPLTGSFFSVALSVYRKIQHPGSYPALCSAEFGLSSIQGDSP